MRLGASAIDGAADDKLTFYLGYEYISFANPSADPNAFIGSTGQGGYLISAVTLNPYQTNKVLQMTWAGLRYDLGANWSFTAGYYHVDQGAYLGTVSKPQCPAYRHRQTQPVPTTTHRSWRITSSPSTSTCMPG